MAYPWVQRSGLNTHSAKAETVERTNFLFSFQDATSSLSHHGFLNYFGPQRFGLDDKEVNACDIGLAMLQGDMVWSSKGNS